MLGRRLTARGRARVLARGGIACALIAAIVLVGVLARSLLGEDVAAPERVTLSAAITDAPPPPERVPVASPVAGLPAETPAPTA